MLKVPDNYSVDEDDRLEPYMLSAIEQVTLNAANIMNTAYKLEELFKAEREPQKQEELMTELERNVNVINMMFSDAKYIFDNN